MKFKTIWTLPGMAFRERLDRTVELWLMKLAHRMPRRLAFWVYVDCSRYIQDDEEVPAVGYTELLDRFPCQ